MNEKKTAEAILVTKGTYSRKNHGINAHLKPRNYFVTHEKAIEAIQEYAAQETAALREENERLKEALKDMVSIAEQHYPEELERQYEPKIKNAKKLIKADSLKQNLQ